MPDVKQTIQNFYRVAVQRDFARDIQFRLLSINPGESSSVTFDENDLVYLTAATLPGKSIQNVAVPYMGLNFNVPGVVRYDGSDSYDLTFYCDSQSAIRRKFEQWAQDIFDDSSSTGNYFTPRQTSVIDMVQLDTQLNRIAQYQLVGVSVRNVGALGYNMSSGTGEVLTFPATISYHYFKRISPVS